MMADLTPSRAGEVADGLSAAHPTLATLVDAVSESGGVLARVGSATEVRAWARATSASEGETGRSRYGPGADGWWWWRVRWADTEHQGVPVRVWAVEESHPHAAAMDHAARAGRRAG